MADIESLRTTILLRRIAGTVELAELLLDGDAPVPPSARRLFERALAEISGLPPAARETQAAALLEGMALRSLGRWQDALEPLSRAANAEPAQVEAWLGLGWCLKRLGRVADAIAVLQAGLAASAERAILYYNLACYHALAGDVPAAVDHLGRAIALDDRYRDMTGTETDFDLIRADPRFLATVQVAA